MSEAITRAQADFVLERMGYEIFADDLGMVAYIDRRYPGDPVHYLQPDFSNGPIPWDDFVRHLESDGANVAVFLAELESA